MKSVQQAYSALKAKLLAGVWSSGDRLPPLAELAELCSVSRTTMWKATTLLKKELLLHTREGGAIIAGPQDQTRLTKNDSRPPPRPGLPESEIAPLQWMRLKERIGRELLFGSFSNPILPPVSKLALRYGVTPRTMKKAMAHLVQEGFLAMEGRRYRIAALKSSHHQRSIALIFEAGSIPYDPRTREVVASFERECLRMGYQCRLEGFDFRKPDGFIEMRRDVEAIRDLEGCVVNIWNPWDKTFRNRWVDLISYLATRSMPVTIIDQGSNLQIPDALLRSKQLRLLRIASKRAGEMAADALFRRGHRHLAYITYSFNSDWVRNRYEGLCRYLKQYGGPDAKAELVEIGDISDQNDLSLALLNLSEEELSALHRKRLSGDELRGLLDRVSRIRRTRLVDRLPQDLTADTVRYLARGVVGLAKQPHDRDVYEMEIERLLHIASEKATELYLQPLLDKVLTSCRATAWVFPDAKSALIAVRFLRNHGKRVPEDIAVLGFDNWREDAEQQLSTYDFNMNGIVQQSLLMIVDPKERSRRPMVSEVDGYVVERRTTRR